MGHGLSKKEAQEIAMRKERSFILMWDSRKDRSSLLFMHRSCICNRYLAITDAFSTKSDVIAGKNWQERCGYYQTRGKIIGPDSRYASAYPGWRRVGQACGSSDARGSGPAALERVFIRTPISKTRLQRTWFESCRDLEGARS